MMPRITSLCGLALLLLASSSDAQQVVFSRRMYAAQGSTFQQLWIVSVSDGRLTQLTRSPRDHEHPVCSPDGTEIFFDAGPDRDRWRFDRKTGVEQPVDGAPPREVVSVDTSTLGVPGCDERAWTRAPDGSRSVCAAHGEDLVIVDLGTRNEIDRIRFGQRYSTGQPYPPWPLQSTWSPDGHRLLVGTYGEGSNSSTAHLDFFLLHLSTRTWTRAMTGNNPVWLPDGDAIIYETPRDLVSLPSSGKHGVWSTHLARFDLRTHMEVRLTSGVTNNVQPSVCGH